jgi:hypothetical protein
MSCIDVCVALFKAELNLFSLTICPVFYSSRSDSYTVTQDLIDSSRLVRSLYSRALLTKSSK